MEIVILEFHHEYTAYGPYILLQSIIPLICAFHKQNIGNWQILRAPLRWELIED